MRYFKKFMYVFSGHRSQLAWLAFIFLGTSILEAFGIGLIGPFLNLASDPENIVSQSKILTWVYQSLQLQEISSLIVLLGVAIIIIFIFKGIIYFIGKQYSYYVLFRQRAAIQERLFSVYIYAPYDFHLSRNTADYINKITTETNRFAYMVSLPLIESFSHLVVVVTLLLLMARTNALLLTIALVALLPAFVLFSFLIKRLKQWGKLSTIAREETIKAVGHGLGGIKETRVIGCEQYFQEQLKVHVDQEAKMETLFQSAQFIPRTLIETLLVVAIIGFICISQLLLDQNFQNAVSAMGVFAVASLRLVPAASQLIEGFGKLRNSSYTLDTMYLDLKEIEAEELDTSASELQSGSKMSSFKETLSLNDVVYQYPAAETPSLKGISLSIRRGESIGLIGQSGAGKTTLVDVILGLLIPQDGDILMDGNSIYSDFTSWKRLIGYIPQSIFLIDDTIERNIAFGVPDDDIDHARVWDAIKSAQLEGLMQDLPQGINTSVGERGVRLSGGQRQRIGIARALYHQREILVLDEATSALDNETEKLISDSIRALAGSKTLIIIAHRLSTIEHCDRIYVLEKGKVATSGSYQDVVLAAKN